MRLSPIVEALRVRCPSFGTRVFGLAEYAAMDGVTMPELPAAFVVPLDEQVRNLSWGTKVRAEIFERFGVVVGLTQSDPRGQAAHDSLHDIRAELWAGIVGWRMDADAGPFAPDGGEPVEMDRSRFLYQYDFARVIAMDSGTDGYRPVLDDFAQTGFRIDAIDPADPNLAQPGPDGRIEAGGDWPVETE